MNQAQPVHPRPAATVMLVRDGSAGLEVFMLERHGRSAFAGGAVVFPGGKVDPADADPACGGPEHEPEQRALRVAAIREVFEECGILLARDSGHRDPVPARRCAELDRRHRTDLLAGRVSLPELARREALELATDLLVPFAHWITPEPSPKRYDTHFYLAPAPSDQTAGHDGRETIGSLWITPTQALADAEAGLRSIVFPTRMNLAKLARSRDVAGALALARSTPVVTVLPRVERRASGAVVRLPADAGYDITEAPLEDLMKSFRR